MTGAAVLAVPALRPGTGGGHLVRCAELVRGLREKGECAYLFADESANGHARCILGGRDFDPAWIVTRTCLAGKSWRLVVLDNFRTTPSEYLAWSKLAPVVAIDEGGFRKGMDFLIDILPRASGGRPANIADPSLLPLPPHPPADMSGSRMPRVLIAFGQEDSAGLGLAAARALGEKAGAALEVVLLNGTLAGRGTETAPKGVTVAVAVPDLSSRLGEYDLVITHFGLTAFEAVYAGVPALLLSPTRLHEKLARSAGFLSAGVGKGRAKRAEELLLGREGVNRAFLADLKALTAALATRHNLDRAPRRTLACLIHALSPDVASECPACGSVRLSDPIARFGERTYRRCRHCGTLGMNRLTPPPIEYDREYFFEFYRRQYGKTYIEDFPNLVAMGKRRLAEIKKMIPGDRGSPRLLDIGCAYGPFLVAARDEGFSPRGIDPAHDAVRHVTQTLGIPAEQGFFPHWIGGDAADYDAITMWYVIEHFRDCAPVLAKAREMLRPGGVLAFATPSFAGVSGRASLNRFLEHSPADHWTIWSPGSCRKALTKAGFRVRKIKSVGHHPERFPVLGRYAWNVKSPAHRILLAVSRLFGLGDTFEVYATRS